MVLPTEKLLYSFFVNTTNMAEEGLIKNLKSFLNSAELVYASGDYTSATILYFKTLFTLLDLLILKGEGRIPKDHTERFRILQEKFPNLYLLLDRYYPVYRTTYSLTIDKQTCEEIRENVKKLIEKQKS